MTPILYPPLEVIDGDLFHSPVEPQAGTGIQERVAAPMSGPVVMPAYLEALVARQVASQQLDHQQPLAVGQIRRITQIPAANGDARLLGRSCGVLLGAFLGAGRWRGWLVAQEADYACERDLVLQEEDGILAPEAAMVQAWNPVDVVLTGDEGLLGKLTMERLAAVMRLAEYRPGESDYVAPRPGRIGGWDLDGEVAVVTGTPLDGETDPRHAYQRLYGRLAQELQASTSAAVPASVPAGVTGLRAWLRRTFVTPAWAVAAVAVIVFQGIMLSGFPGLFDAREPIYRGAGQARTVDPCAIRLRLVFVPDAPYADVAVALRRAGAILIDGPSETGEVWVLPPKDQDPAEAAAMLRESHLVEQVDVIAPSARLCRK